MDKNDIQIILKIREIQFKHIYQYVSLSNVSCVFRYRQHFTRDFLEGNINNLILYWPLKFTFSHKTLYILFFFSHSHEIY